MLSSRRSFFKLAAAVLAAPKAIGAALERLVPSPKLAHHQVVFVAQELLEDSSFDIQGFLRDELVAKMERAENRMLFDGYGFTSPPVGDLRVSTGFYDPETKTRAFILEGHRG